MRSIKSVIAVGAVTALMVPVAVIPALAEDNSGDDHDEYPYYYYDSGYDDGFFFDGLFFDDNEDFDRVFEDGIVQETEQEAESGDVDQTFDVSGTGDNSNQTVGTQGVANTGNAQNAIGVIDDGDLIGHFDDDRVVVDDDGFFRDFDGDGDVQFEEVGSTIDLSPTQTVTSDQQVNQAASASSR